MASFPRQIGDAYARLSLAPRADAKAIRRAYAAALKQIDQETQAEAFGALRAAYELALAWERQPASDAGQGELDAFHAGADSDARPAADASAGTSASPGLPDDTPHGSPYEASYSAPYNAPHDAPSASPAAADEIDAALREWLVRIVDRGQSHPGAVIAEALQDERLVALSAQEILETRIATVLVQDPWLRAALFDAAARHFQWDTNHGATLADHRLSAWIMQACNESLLWRSQSERDRLRQSRTIDAILACPLPDEKSLYRHFFAMDELLRHFPLWTSLRMPGEVLQAWSRAYRDPAFKPPPTLDPATADTPAVPSLSWWRKQIFGRNRSAPSRVSAPRSRPALNWRLTLFLLFACITGLRTLVDIGGTTHRPSYSSSSYSSTYPASGSPPGYAAPAYGSPGYGAYGSYGSYGSYGYSPPSYNQRSPLQMDIPRLPPTYLDRREAQSPEEVPEARTVKEVDAAKAHYVGKNPRPIYPVGARARREQGNVMVRINVDPDGQITDTKVEKSSGHAELDEAALRSLVGIRLEPVLDQDKPVRFSALIPFNFTLR